jgi:hypothetical protein
MMNNTFREEIIELCKQNSACQSEFRRLANMENDSDFCNVLKDNFNWCVNNNVLTVEIIEKYKDVFNDNSIYVNQSVQSGYLLVNNATVKAGGSATVEAWENATVKAWENATVKAWENATVKAGGNATVEAWENATVEAWGNATVEAGENATVEAWGNATVKAWGNATVKAWENATVKAGGNATVEAWENATVEAWGNATVYENRKAKAYVDKEEAFTALSSKITHLEFMLLHVQQAVNAGDEEKFEQQMNLAKKAHTDLDDFVTEYERKCEGLLEAKGKKIGVMDLMVGQLVIPLYQSGEGGLHKVRTEIEHRKMGNGYSLQHTEMEGGFEIYEGAELQFLLIQEAE